MPFDYNSFLKGVQTGMRLGRTTPGRIPPTPPTPSGQYILTESGEHILTELMSPTILKFASTDIWYSMPKSVIPGMEDVVYGCLSVSDGQHYQLFGARWGSQSNYQYIILSGEPFAGKTITYTYYADTYPTHRTVSYGPIEASSKAGAYYYYIFDLYNKMSAYYALTDDVMTYVSYTYSVFLENIIANISSQPLITEGDGESA